MRQAMPNASAYGLDSPREDWQERAACRGYDPEWWTLTGRVETAENQAAKAICATCPVQRQCRDLAERTGSWGVIYGGQPYFEPRGTREIGCGLCGSTFTANNGNARYCSDYCREKAHQRWKQQRRAMAQ